MGFTPIREAEAAEGDASAERGMLDKVGRAVGRTVRAGVQGITALPNMIGDAVGLNSSQTVKDWLTKAGLPQAENATERFAEDVAGGMAGAGGMVKLGQGMANAVSPITKKIGELLATNPGAQVVSGATGPGAASAVREEGGGAGAQLAAGLAGGFAPAVVPSIAETVRRAIRGGEAGRVKVADTIRDFEDAGAGSPTVAQATQGRAARTLESGLSKAPGGAGLMVRTAEGEAAGMGDKVDAIASSMSTRSGAAPAGREIRAGLGRFADSFKTTGGKLYDELDTHIPLDTRIDVTATQRALAALNADIPGAPNISRFFQNAKIKGMEGALKADLDEPTKLSNALAQAKAELQAAMQSRNAALQEAGKFETFAANQSSLADNFTPVPGMPRVPGRLSVHPERAAEGAAAAVDAKALAQTRFAAFEAAQKKVADLEQSVALLEGKLPYEAMKKLRTLVGQEISNSNLVSDVPRSKWKALYGALSEDLATAAKAAGPDAEKAFARANKYYSAGMKRIDGVLDPILAKTDPEDIYKAVVSGTSEGATTLRGVMKSLPEESRKVVASTTLRRLGKAVNSKQDELGEVFSTETFLTNWNKLHGDAKTALFSSLPDDMRKDLDKIARVASNIRDGSKVFANPSGTAQASMNQLTAGAAILSVLTGNVGAAGAIAGTVAASNAAARIMTSPIAVKWLAQSTRVPVEQLPAQLNVLSQQIFRMPKDEREDAREFVREMRQTLQGQQAPAPQVLQ